LRVRQLRFLDLLAAAGSLAATAERLSISPSAASMMLKEIEGLFGAQLFRRQGRGMALTDAGRALLPRCQTVLGEISAIGSALRGPGTPVLRLGAFPHTTTTLLPDIVGRLVSGQPPWRVLIVDGTADELLQRLLQDAAGTAAVEGLAQRVLYQSSLSVVAARRHPLAGQRQVALAELLAWPWILPGPQSTTRVAVIDAFQRQGLEPPAPVAESPSFFYSLSVVAQTELLTCCVDSAALQSNQATSILPVTIGSNAAPVALVWRKSSALARQAVDCL
jgi:DNA-binding transcriptional LysR family regulator